jgi:hypothetical protein
VYDYFYNQWGTFFNWNAIDTVAFDGSQVFLGSDGYIRQETLGIYTDNGLYIPLYAETGWLNVSGIQGFFRALWCMVLGNFYSDHQLNIGLAYNFNPAMDVIPIQISGVNGNVWGTSTPWGADPVWGGSGEAYQWRVFFSQQKVETLKMSFGDQQIPGSTVVGRGLGLSALNLEVAGKKGTWRPNALRGV